MLGREEVLGEGYRAADEKYNTVVGGIKTAFGSEGSDFGEGGSGGRRKKTKRRLEMGKGNKAKISE